MHGLCGLVAQWFMKFPPPSLPILPGDIIYDILLLLPVKSLARFRCVCREWNNLLTGGSDFIKKHLDYGHRRLFVSSFESLLSMDLEAPMGNFVATDLDFPWRLRVRIIMGSCNGLLCVLVGNNLFLWNPSTKEYKQLPPFSRSFHRIFYGFGYSMSIDGCYNYKVVRGESYSILEQGIRRCKVEIYTRKTNSWKRIQDFPYRHIFHARGTFVNGILHWLAIRGSGKDFFGPIIASLDLGKEEFGEVLLPNFEQPSLSLGLGVLNGMLCVVYSNTRTWDVYAMKEYGVPQSWITLITIPSFLWINETIHFQDIRMPLYLTKNGELVMQVREHEMAMYDPRKNIFKKLIRTNFRDIESTIYVESLESP